MDAVKKINEELNITVIIVSHLPDVQKYLADRVILLEDGEITDEGTPEEIMQCPESHTGNALNSLRDCFIFG